MQARIDINEMSDIKIQMLLLLTKAGVKKNR